MDDDDYDSGDLSGDGSDLFDSLSGGQSVTSGLGAATDAFQAGTNAALGAASTLGGGAATTAAPISSSTFLIFGAIAIVALLAIG
jgi:hypothetical protein